MKVGSLVTYTGEWIPNIFPGDKSRQPDYGIVIEMDRLSEGTNICVHWLQIEEQYWHEKKELEVISE